MSLVQILGLVITVLLLVIWYIRSVQKRYDEGEDNQPTLPAELVNESYSVFDDMSNDDTPAQPVTLQDLGTATNR